MEKTIKFLSFWAINDDLNIERLKEQLNQMKGVGLAGTIFHPRYYTGRPPYMGKEYLGILSELILYAKEIGMEFWIYDENGWPSGTGDGKVLERFPESTCQWLEYENGQVAIREKRNFNTLIREEMDYFIQVVYEGYRTGLEPEAFDWIKGFFSDEVGFLDGHGASLSEGGIPWCEEAGNRYREQYGQDIRESWQLLFTEGQGYRQVRYRYWEVITDILAEGFYKNINDWCETYGKRYTAHLKGEETIFFQIPCSGSCFQNLKYVNVPAVDALERYPGNPYYPRIASSLARQFSDGECLVEVFGGSGWGLSPKHAEDMTGWLAESGINNFALHLWQYNRSAESMRDWPPNIPCGLNWYPAADALFEKMKARWQEPVRTKPSVLLVAPVRGAMAEFHPMDARALNEHNGAGTPDTKAGKISKGFAAFVEQCYREGMEFDVTEERILEQHGELKDGKLWIGRGCYDMVIASEHGLFEQEERIAAMKDMGLWHTSVECSWQFAGIGKNQLMLEVFDEEIAIPCKGGFGEPGICCLEVWVSDPVCLKKWMKTSSDGRLHLGHVQADCAKVLVDGRDFGYTWAEDWTVEGVAEGLHLVEVWLYPSTYNANGPHHYLEGDYRLTSPMHYQGNKHFGDEDDAPDHTHVPEYHFVKFGIGG